MSGLTWHHIPDWLENEEKELDCQVIQAALIRDISGRADIVPDLSIKEIKKPLRSNEEVRRKIEG